MPGFSPRKNKILSSSNERISQNTKFVPWYSTAEWRGVYKKIYSDDTETMQDAYKKLCIWNARSTDLPAGIESTMELLQVMLRDRSCQDQNSRSYSEKDLALMYSSAILRFLNHLKSMHRQVKENKVASMYDMASEYGIPDWIINLRHEASHQCSLPSIHILRSAWVIAFEWLKDNYWAKLADQMEDVIVAHAEECENMRIKVETLLTLWQATQIQIMMRRYSINDIPNENLRYHLEYALETNDICVTHGKIQLDELLQEVDCEGDQSNELDQEDDCKATSSTKVTKARKVLLEIFKNLLPKQRTNTENVERILVESLIQSELFIPKDHDHRLFVKDEALNSAFCSLWASIIEAYHEADLTTDLIEALVAFASKCREPSHQLIASCWLAHVCLSLHNAAQPCFTITRTKPGKIRKLLALNLLRNEHLRKEAIDFLFSNDLAPLMLTADHSLRNTILERTVYESVYNANPNSRIYLRSLIDLLNPPLTNSAKEDLLHLVELYTNMSDQLTQTETSEIFTLDSLKQIANENSEDTCMEVNELEADAFGWVTKDHGITGWSKCALGCLPSTYICDDRSQ
ncbi:uncharacterized protein LOC111056163 [Nilaparvata lugens]|uniref:uncharacterized protein LOC111056163 n=1 Tax=Nilaparvata lugens TaxID=108931 RepID=UPI00193E4E96|nr:uncharacterized protein LOC111056163 [Nilaparvata lugens]